MAQGVDEYDEMFDENSQLRRPMTRKYHDQIIIIHDHQPPHIDEDSDAILQSGTRTGRRANTGRRTTTTRRNARGNTNRGRTTGNQRRNGTRGVQNRRQNQQRYQSDFRNTRISGDEIIHLYLDRNGQYD